MRDRVESENRYRVQVYLSIEVATLLKSRAIETNKFEDRYIEDLIKADVERAKALAHEGALDE